MSTPIPLDYYLILGAFLFCTGLVIVLVRKNVIVVLMGIELMFNAANINLVAFSQYDPARLGGQFFTLFIIVVAAAETVIALAIIIQVYRQFGSIDLDSLQNR